MIMKPEQVESNQQLEIGEYYFLLDKITGDISIKQCLSESGRLHFGKIWATDENNQALERWRILGPVQMPTREDFYRQK
jgi:hypothetical protein